MPPDSPPHPLKAGLRRGWDRLAYARLRRRVAGRTDRSLTAMFRVKDEEQFLGPAVRSIADLVETVVIVDNMSTDGTGAVIAELTEECANIASFQYPHSIFRVGREHAEARHTTPVDDPRRLASFYNWCLAKCETPFVVKWDGDMIATDRGREMLADWAGRRELTGRFLGTNVAPDLTHRLASNDAATIAGGDPLRPGSGMVDHLAFTVSEPRIFERTQAHYVDGQSWEQLMGPFINGDLCEPDTWRVEESCYLHLKYAKHDPHSNQSEEFAEAVRQRERAGDPLSADEAAALRWL